MGVAAPRGVGPAGSDPVRWSALVLSCEHASERVPSDCRAMLGSELRWAGTHRAYDPGAAELARVLARRLKAPVHLAPVSRMLVDPNRDEGHPAVFGPSVRRTPAEQREDLLARYHRPYRDGVRERLRDGLARLGPNGRLLHLSVHSFTPRLRGITRSCELGIMYDPGRSEESRLAEQWLRHFAERDPRLRVRRNYPYVGKSIYFQPHLRSRLRDRRYLALQIEFSQKLPRRQPDRWKRFQDVLVEALRDTRTR
ncbi:MAG: N-formylglutamate amidohydrolase [Planctomycetes bacterium]|nr:N-formylglutamate amidohydrolase [Planctomycetota bacterium]